MCRPNALLWALLVDVSAMRPRIHVAGSVQHRVQFVTVEDGVRLEVLDWGGSGKPLVLLTGSGNTAHVFDELAGKLTPLAHVYGVTRRGFGASSHPDSGYTDQRLRMMSFMCWTRLKLLLPFWWAIPWRKRVTNLRFAHPDRVGGLVYLDAGADPKDFPASDPAYMALADKLPPANRLPLPPPFPESESHASATDYQSARHALKAIGEGTKNGTIPRSGYPCFRCFRLFVRDDPLRHDIPKDLQGAPQSRRSKPPRWSTSKDTRKAS